MPTPRDDQPASEAPAIVWFRRDLRLSDNPALHAARASGRPVVPLYVLDESPAIRPLGGASKWWLDKSLASLARDLEAIGSRLILRRGPAEAVLAALVQETGAGLATWNRLYDPGYPERDGALERRLVAAGVEVSTHEGCYLLAPDAVQKKAGGTFNVFTPFWRAARTLVEERPALPRPSQLKSPARWPACEALASWGLHPTRPDWSTGFDWRPGEADADALLREFLSGALKSYAADRDRPGVEGTSRLSPHLHWGEIGPRQVWRAAHRAQERRAAPDDQIDKFLAEVGWREFNLQILANKGDLAKVSFDPAFDRFPFRRDPQGLKAWQKGLTGYPMVDAGMRQLWALGWMHNRVRLITASFLVKHLLIDWREGEAWFWDTLVDADHANNAGNWQWVAGSGADASPWFRIFNPVTQGEKFDPSGDYIRRWAPELAKLPASAIHAPWTAPPDVLAAAGVQLGRTYPRPIVDHAAARARALDALKSLRAA